MPYSAGSFSLYSTGNPVQTGTTISSTWANNTLNDIATGLSTCLLKDGTQTVTANIPMGGFKFTGLAAGSASGNSLRYEQVNGVVTTAGDVLYASAAGTLARLAIGTAYQRLATNAGATAPEWVADTQNTVVTTAGDLVYGTANRTIARLAIGGAGALLQTNSGATAPEWLAIGATAGHVLTSNGTAAAWAAPKVPLNSQNAGYTAVLADAGKAIVMATAGTFTIPANASVAYETGTVLTFINNTTSSTIPITSDTMTLAGTATTGTRTLAANGIATAIKITATTWFISGSGLT